MTLWYRNCFEFGRSVFKTRLWPAIRIYVVVVIISRTNQWCRDTASN